jgi:hypothetical protein
MKPCLNDMKADCRRHENLTQFFIVKLSQIVSDFYIRINSNPTGPKPVIFTAAGLLDIFLQISTFVNKKESNLYTKIRSCLLPIIYCMLILIYKEIHSMFKINIIQIFTSITL